ILWSGTQLLFAAMDRISAATASASFLGRNVATAQPSFPGSPPNPGPAFVREQIAAKLGKPSTYVPTYADLVAYLVKGPLVAKLRAADPAIDGYLRVFENTLGSVAGLQPAIEVLLAGETAFATSSGALDPQAALRPLTDALRAFVQAQVRETLT